MKGLQLYIADTQEVRDGLTRFRFNWGAERQYMVDDWVMDFLDVASECPDGFRPVAVHIVPYTVVDGEIVYYAFSHPETTTLYVSLPIENTDFVGRVDNPMMSFARTVVGKIIRTMDQPNINMNIDPKEFHFPAVIDGEYVWAVEVKGDNNFVVDEMVKQLGTVLGRITHSQVLADTDVVNTLSQKIVTYKRDNPDSKDMFKPS